MHENLISSPGLANNYESNDLRLKELVLLAITIHARPTLLVKIKLAQIIFKTSFENSQIITPGCLDASCFQIWYHICIIFPRKYLISLYHISSYPPIMQGYTR